MAEWNLGPTLDTLVDLSGHLWETGTCIRPPNLKSLYPFDTVDKGCFLNKGLVKSHRQILIVCLNPFLWRLIIIVNETQPEIFCKIKAHLWLCLQRHFQRGTIQGRKPTLNICGTCPQTEGRGGMEGEKQLTALSLCFLIVVAEADCSLTFFLTYWIEVTEIMRQTISTFFKLFLSGVLSHETSNKHPPRFRCRLLLSQSLKW